MVGERGFEPPTPWSRTRCSTRLSHSPNTVDGASKGRGLARSFPSSRSLKCNRVRALKTPVAHALRETCGARNESCGHGAQVKQPSLLLPSKFTKTAAKPSLRGFDQRKIGGQIPDSPHQRKAATVGSSPRSLLTPQLKRSEFDQPLAPGERDALRYFVDDA